MTRLKGPNKSARPQGKPDTAACSVKKDAVSSSKKDEEAEGLGGLFGVLKGLIAWLSL